MNDSHKLYDKILRELPKDLSIQDADEYNEVDLRYLASCVYISLTETATGNIFAITLTTSRLKFISEGGFAQQNKIKAQAEADAELQRQNWITTTNASKGARKISIISLIIAGLSLILAAIAYLK